MNSFGQPFEHRWAIRINRVAFFALLFTVISWGTQSWFKVKGLVGIQEREYTLIFSLDSIPVYKGVHREAPEHIADQTYGAHKMVLNAWYQAPDTGFAWSYVAIVRQTEGRLLPVWANAVRQGRESNEWSLISFIASPQIRFHSSIYGDGIHDGLAGVVPEEHLWLESIQLSQSKLPGTWKVMSPIAEMPYIRRVWTVRGSFTDQRMRIDAVDAGLVRFEREDGAFMEVWISLKGRQILRVRSFRGTWFEKFQ